MAITLPFRDGIIKPNISSNTAKLIAVESNFDRQGAHKPVLLMLRAQFRVSPQIWD